METITLVMTTEKKEQQIQIEIYVLLHTKNMMKNIITNMIKVKILHV